MRFLSIAALLILALFSARAGERVLTTIREVQALSLAEAEREPAVMTMRDAALHFQGRALEPAFVPWVQAVPFNCFHWSARATRSLVTIGIA